MAEGKIGWMIYQITELVCNKNSPFQFASRERYLMPGRRLCEEGSPNQEYGG